MVKRKFQILHSQLFVWLTVIALRLYAATLRLKVENEAPWLRHLHAGGRVLLCSWHQQFYPLVCYFTKFSQYKPSIMISRSKDGEFIAQICRSMGWRPVRGSSSKGGATALKDMIANVRQHRLAGHILDGPRGPVGKVKKGVIFMATSSDARIVPVYVRPHSAWFFRKSWDQFFVPKPFSKVTICYGDMLDFGTTQDPEMLERHRRQLEDQMRPALLLTSKKESIKCQ